MSQPYDDHGLHLIDCSRPNNQSINAQDVSPSASFQTNPSLDMNVLVSESSSVPTTSSPTLTATSTIKVATRKRRNSARMSSPEFRFPPLPAQQYHSDEEVSMRHDIMVLTQAEDANFSSDQVKPHLSEP